MLTSLLALIPGIGPFAAVASSAASNWKMIAGAGAAVAVGVFVYSWDSRGRQISSLEEVNATLQANLQDAKRMLDIEKQASVAAIARAQAAEKTQVKIAQITQEAHSADKSKDGPVAPVLRHTLDALGGLRKPPSH